MSSARPIKAVVFDFDGVVLDSAHLKTVAFPELFKAYPEHQEAIRAHHLAQQGVSRYAKFDWIYKTLLRQPLSAEKRQQLGEDFSALVLDKVLAAPMIAGAQAFLAYLQTQDILAFVASGTPEKELIHINEQRQLSGYFERIEGSPKSKTTIVQQLMLDYNLKAEEMIFLGDSHTDLAAAQAIGLTFVGIATQPEDDFWGGNDFRVVADLSTLIPLFKIQQVNIDES